MKPNVSGLYLPSNLVLKQWNDIKDLPIVETAPRSVPFTTMIESACQDDFEYWPASFLTISGAGLLPILNKMNELTKKIENHIYTVYQYRSRTAGIEEEIQKLNSDRSDLIEKVSESAKIMLNELLETQETMKLHIEEAKNELCKLMNMEIWKNGQYCDILIDKFCFLLFRLISLNFLCINNEYNSPLLSDIEILAKLSNEESKSYFQTSDGSNKIKNELIDLIKNSICSDIFEKLMTVIWLYVESKIATKEYIHSDYETAYIITLMFLIDCYYSLSQTMKMNLMKMIGKDIYPFILAYRDQHPNLLLIFEFGVPLNQFLTNEDFQKLPKNEKRPNFPFFEMKNELNALFNEFKQDYSYLTTSEKPHIKTISNTLIKLPKIFQKINNSIFTIREMISFKTNSISSTGKFENNFGNDIENSADNLNEINNGNRELPPSNFEIAMTKYFEDDEREFVMQILAICRSFRELILSDLPTITSIFSKSIYDCIQEFVITKLGMALTRSLDVKDIIEKDINQIKLVFKSSMENKSAPHICMIDLLRIAIQQFVNPESPTSYKKGFFTKCLAKEDFDTFVDFLKTTQFFTNIIKLEYTVTIVCDQSSLYFKETFLNIYRSKIKFQSGNLNTTNNDNTKTNSLKRVIYFPVTSALPYVLIDHSISQANDEKELTGAIFYPLSIYDDAAKTALQVLHSKELFEEIVAESRNCLSLISESIADHAFQTVRKFFTERAIEQQKAHIVTMPKLNNKYSSLRIATILQQNQLFLIGSHCDVKNAFAKRLTELFIQYMSNNLKVVQKFGVLGIFVFSQMVKIFRDMHQFFLDCNQPISNFDEIIQYTLKTGTPNSFSSYLLECVIHDINNRVIPNYFIHSNPYRIIPPLNNNGIMNYIDSNIGIIPQFLKNTAFYITIDHFRELFTYIDDGAVVILINGLKSLAVDAFHKFLEKYMDIKNQIYRIYDLPLSSGSYKSFSRYEVAYRSLISDKKVDDLFIQMRSIGNILILADMIDKAFALKVSSTKQFLAYLFGSQPVDSYENELLDRTSDDIFSLFDSKFKENKKLFECDKNGNLVVAPSRNDIYQPFRQQIIQEFVQLCHENKNIFIETSYNVLDFKTLTGFAAIWSVLEFVFCLKEVCRTEDKSVSANGSIETLGEGVLTTSALILCITKQIPMSRAFSIGEKIEKQKKVDVAVLDDEAFNNYFNSYFYIKSSIDCSIAYLSSSVEMANKQISNNA